MHIIIETHAFVNLSMYLPYEKGVAMAERKPKIEVVVEDEQEKLAVARAAEQAGYDNPGAYVRALLRREGVPLRQQQRGGWRGEPKEEQVETSSPHAAVSPDTSGLLCVETADTP